MSDSPTIIDQRFVLQSRCGRGGVGTVWKALDLSSQGPVALKLLDDTSADQIRRFAREGKLLAQLAHPGIVSHIAHGTTPEGVPYLAMEWLEGESVAERLAREPLGLHASLALLRSALAGLCIAHRHGVVHRDLKPSNLFLRQRRVDDVVLLDLGLARQLSEAHPLTRSGSVLGTPAYMAPEQARGERKITPACDVHALGCLLFECLTGAPPFSGSQVYALLAKVLFEPAPRLRDVRADMPEQLEQLLERMLVKDPSQRFADAPRLLERLNELAPVLDLAAPAGAASVPRTGWVEQELVSVVLGAPNAEWGLGAGATVLPDQTSEAAPPEISACGGELRWLADGSVVVVVAQQGSAATDLAARAARCALRLRTSCPSARLVVATGRGIREQHQHCLGEAIDRAGTMLRALSDREEPAIWLDEVTGGLLDARFQQAPQNELLTVFTLAGEDPSVDAARLLLGRPTACVGRERELGMLELTLGACLEEREPHALLVCGPPGIGKSRLRHEFLRSCERREQPLTVLLGLGDPLRAAGTRSLLGAALARWLGLTRTAQATENWAQLQARLAQRALREPRLVATFLGELCGLVAPEPLSAELRAARQNPNIMADRVSSACLELLRSEASAQPVLLVLDDLQWSDAPTIALVGTALRELRGLPFFVLALGRPETPELFPDLWSPRLTSLALHPLAQGATRRLIRQVLGEHVPEDTVQRIVAQAGGNALLLEELIRATSDRRERVPETVLAMLQARIGLLPAPERRVLRTASVLGEAFPPAGVSALLQADEDTPLESALAALREQEILERHSDDRSTGSWRFRHALMRDAAYELLTEEDRARLHRRAASYLEETGEDPVVVAQHAERGAEPERAIRHYGTAATRAYLRNDLAAVVTLVARGVACGATGEHLGMLRCIEAPALSYQHDFAAGWASSQAALALLPPGHPKRLASLAANTFAGLQLGKVVDAQIEELLLASPDPGALAEYMTALGYAGIAHIVLGQRQYAVRVIARVCEIAAMVGADDAFSLGHAHYWQLRFLEMLGDDTYALEQHARHAATFNERAGNRRMLAVTWASLAECLRRRGPSAAAEPLFRQATQLAREVGEPISWSFVQQYLASYLAEQGSEAAWTEADALALQAIELAGDGQVYRALALIARALVALGRGTLRSGTPDRASLDSADQYVREARERLRTLQLRAYQPHVDSVFLRIQLARGELAAAAAGASEAEALLESHGPLGVTELPLRLWIVRTWLALEQSENARRSLGAALAALELRARRIPQGALREDFYARVPEHAALLEHARELSSTDR